MKQLTQLPYAGRMERAPLTALRKYQRYSPMILAALIAILASAVWPIASQAQTWYGLVQGTVAGSPAFASGSSPDTFGYSVLGQIAGVTPAPYNSSNSTPTSHTASSEASMNLTATLYWVPGGGQTEPPSTVTVAVYENSTAADTFYSWSPFGLSDFQQCSEVQDNYNDPATYSPYYSNGDLAEALTCQGTQIMTLSVNSSATGTIPLNGLPVSYVGTATIPDQTFLYIAGATVPSWDPYGLYTMGRSSMGVLADDRTVSINTAPTYYKATQGTDLDNDPIWSRKQNPPGVGDIGIADGYPQNIAIKGGGGLQGSLTPQTQTVTYSAILSLTGWNYSGMTYTWFDNKTGTTERGTYGQGYNISNGPWTNSSGIGNFDVTYAGAELNNDGTLADRGETGGKAAHIHISVTDGTGAVCTGNYYLTIHRSIVETASNRPTTTSKGLPLYAYMPATIRQYLSNPKYPTWLNPICEVRTVAPNLASEILGQGLEAVEDVADYIDVDPTVLLAFGLTKIGVSDVNLEQSDAYANWDDCWGQPLGSNGAGQPVSNYHINNDLITDYDSNREYLLMYMSQFWERPHIEQAYTSTWWLADAYDAQGFTGESKVAVLTAIPNIGFPWGQFTTTNPYGNNN